MLIKEKEFKDLKYLNWLHNNKPCIVCGNRNIEVHHIKKMNLVRKRNDLMVLPLCTEHHRGKFSPHGANSFSFYEEYPLEMQMQLSVVNYSEYKADL